MKTLTDTEYLQRVILNPYIPHEPFSRQGAFLSLVDREALYGGAAGGGKSDALLMGALMYVEEPGYNSILFRKTYSDLALPEAVMARSHEWLAGTDASWDGSNYRWTFPSGATLSFGYLNHDKDKYRYQSAAFQFIGFDELTQFPSDHYLYLFSRLRRLASNAHIPLRMRAGTNPGGMGNDWVYERFVVDKQRPFVPALLADNPFIDQVAYRESLAELDETTRRQLERGEWVTNPEGKPFKREWWRGQGRYHIDGRRPAPVARVVSWDTAFEAKASSAFTAYVVGEVMPDYRLCIRHVGRDKLIFPDLADEMRSQLHTWDRDGKLKAMVIEGQASGKSAIQTLRASASDSVAAKIHEFSPKGSKEERASQVSVWCKRGLVLLPHPSEDTPWLDTFERELFGFPDTLYKDQVDAFVQLVAYLENYLVASWHGNLAARPRRHAQRSRVQRVLEPARV